MRNERLKIRHNFWFRLLLVSFSVIILVLVYIFQRIDILAWVGLMDFSSEHPNFVFSINRIVRVVLNDFACFILIFVFFERKHLKVAFFVFLIELFFILPLYLLIKLSLEGDSEISSPLLSQIHRLIVNPTLMVLLIAGFIYQKFIEKASV
jgi:hypothetical protein